MPEIIWTIVDLERHTATGVITKVYWKCRAVEDDLVAELGDVAPIYRGDAEEIVDFANSDAFTKFTEITEEKVFQFLFNYFGEFMFEKIKSDLIESLKLQKDLKIHTKGIPW